MQGKLTIVGARAMARVVERWVAIFRREHPDVDVIVAPAGSGVVAEALADGVADVAPLPRVLNQSERGLTMASSRDPRGVVVGFASARGQSSARPLVIYLNKATGGQPNGIATEFARVALSPEGQRQFAAGALTGVERKHALSALGGLVGGMPATAQ
ncbi:substrate-binding domain-containing protein [Sphingomonas panacisoli]|uniref:substrate-binding domain-containing protein n=1 Tax=Sphingomonas panacisoli TaxID=1813879 RepID=UPI001647888B|nr:substrate-binding domain-containing protein [Sphingomonas panacisoli]